MASVEERETGERDEERRDYEALNDKIEELSKSVSGIMSMLASMSAASEEGGDDYAEDDVDSEFGDYVDLDDLETLMGVN